MEDAPNQYKKPDVGGDVASFVPIVLSNAKQSNQNGYLRPHKIRHNRKDTAIPHEYSNVYGKQSEPFRKQSTRHSPWCHLVTPHLAAFHERVKV